MANAAAMGVLLNISRRRVGAANVRSAASGGPQPEASAVLVTEAGFAPDGKKKAKKKKSKPAPGAPLPEGA